MRDEKLSQNTFHHGTKILTSHCKSGLQAVSETQKNIYNLLTRAFVIISSKK